MSTIAQKKILLIEDELYIRELFGRVLEKEGYNVEYADNGEDGFNKIVQGEHDLILLDIMLPKIDGLNILKKLKESKLDQKIKNIVILSNLDQELAISEGVSLGARSYLVKSKTTPQQLKEEVAAIFTI